MRPCVNNIHRKSMYIGHLNFLLSERDSFFPESECVLEQTFELLATIPFAWLELLPVLDKLPFAEGVERCE